MAALIWRPKQNAVFFMGKMEHIMTRSVAATGKINVHAIVHVCSFPQSALTFLPVPLDVTVRACMYTCVRIFWHLHVARMRDRGTENGSGRDIGREAGTMAQRTRARVQHANTHGS